MTVNNKSSGVSQNHISETAVDPHDPMQRLEEALVLCKFGRFHIRLMFAALASSLAANMTVTVTSFILPNAECDLNMTLMQKGLLSAAPFVGQIATAFFTGFLTDAFGRKPFLVWAHFGLFICTIIEGSSQTYLMMLIVKLVGGLLVCFSYNTTPAFLSECTHKDVRDRIMIVNSSFMALASVVSAVVAWCVLPLSLDFSFFNGNFVLHSWNIYLYLCGLWSGFAALQFSLLPESPKFLLAHGQNAKALEILQNIYCENTGNDKKSFPIQSLDDPKDPKERTTPSMKKMLREATFNMKELFRRPLLLYLILISVMIFLCLLSISALRIWFPQISTIVENYKTKNDGEPSRFCVMITDYTDSLGATYSNNETQIQSCISLSSGTDTFVNGIIMGVTAMCAMFIVAYLVAITGQKPLIFLLLMLSSAFSVGLYWTNSSIQIGLMISCILAFVQTTYGLLGVMYVRIFPTTVRTLALSIILMNGRVGSLSGSLLFPMMLQEGCMLPFILLSASTIVVGLLSTLLPNTSKRNQGGDK